VAVRTGGRRKETKLQEEEQEGGAGRRRHGEPEISMSLFLTGTARVLKHKMF